MILKSELERIITNDLKKVLTTDIVYQYSTYTTSLNEIILKQSLRFSDPMTFNDPFDCNEKLLKIHFNEDVVDTTIRSLPLDRKARRNIKKELQNKSMFNGILKQKRKEYKLSCFSCRYDEILMWSHYADKHSGICIGYEFPPIYKDNFILCPVKYLDALKEIEGTVDVERVILYWLTTKSMRWEYEKEIRAITKCKYPDSEHEYINYDSRYIKEVIFGCNVSAQDIELAIRKIKDGIENFRNITFKRMKVDEDTFLLNSEIIQI